MCWGNEHSEPSLSRHVSSIINIENVRDVCSSS